MKTGFLKSLTMGLLLSLPLFYLTYNNYYNKKDILVNSQEFFLEKSNTAAGNAILSVIGGFEQKINSVAIPNGKNKDQVTSDITNFSKQYPFYVAEFLTTDGKILYRSNAEEANWNFTAITTSWYRKVIRTWRITFSDRFYMPVAPFPEVIAIVLPASKENKIEGMWIIYMTAEKMNTLFGFASDNSPVKNLLFLKNGIQLYTGSYSMEKGNDIYRHLGKDSFSSFSLPDQKDILTYQNKIDKYDLVLVSLVNMNLIIREIDTELTYSIIISVIGFILITSLTVFVFNYYEKNKLLLEKTQLQSKENSEINNHLVEKQELLNENIQSINILNEVISKHSHELETINEGLKLRQIFLTNLSIPVIITDKDGNYFWSNNKANHLLNNYPNILKDCPVDHFLFQKNKGEFLSLVKKCTADKAISEASKIIEFSINNNSVIYSVHGVLLTQHNWQGIIFSFMEITSVIHSKTELEKLVFENKINYKMATLFEIGKPVTDLISSAFSIFREIAKSTDLILYKYDDSEKQFTLYNSLTETKEELLDNISIENSLFYSSLVSKKSLYINQVNQLATSNKIKEEVMLNNPSAIFPIYFGEYNFGILLMKFRSQDEWRAIYKPKLEMLIGQFCQVFEKHFLYNKIEEQNSELLLASELKTTLLNSITHELKNPLSSLKGYLYLLHQSAKELKSENHLLIDYLIKADLSADELNHQIDNYLEVSRFEKGTVSVQPEWKSFSEFIDPIKSFLVTEAAQKNITTDFLFSNITKKFIYADHGKLFSIITNIAKNSLNYAPDHSQLKIMIASNDEELFIAIEDNGLKIHPDDFIKMFREFQTPSPKGTGRLYTGTGLDMFITGKIVKLMGGKINIESSEEKTKIKCLIPVLITNEINQAEAV